ncbi:MAG: RraA family protein [Alphaproteobacteria bacterium]|nr:RraA family protein [Alphaproteobacteria bacterium]
MALRRHEVTFEILSREFLDGFGGLAAAQVGDAMNREQIMAAAIKPIAEGTRICGQARTVNAMAGDNGIIHAAIPHMRPGEILVVNGMGVKDVAIWGEVMTHAAQKQGIAGIVLDGAVRDVAEMREMGFPVFCRAVVPRGPHKGFGGTIDGVISCAGVAVSPGDLVIGDDDGVAVVPLAQVRAVQAAAIEAQKREWGWLEEIAKGKTTRELLGLPEPELVPTDD